MLTFIKARRIWNLIAWHFLFYQIYRYMAPAAFVLFLDLFSDPNFSIPDPGTRVKKIPNPGSGSAPKNVIFLKVLHPKTVSMLLEKLSGMSIPDPDFLPVPGPGVKKAPDPGSGGFASLPKKHKMQGIVISRREASFSAMASAGDHFFRFLAKHFCQVSSYQSGPVLRNCNYFLRFWFRLSTSYGPSFGSRP